MPKTPKIPLGLKGLNSDTPAHAVGFEFFSEGKNLRPFNGALNGVNSFSDETTISFDVSGESSAPVGIYDAAQFTPAGSNFYNIIALVKHADGVFRVKAYSSDSLIANQQVIIQDKTITCNGLATVTAGAQLIQETSGATATIRYDTTQGTDIRIFNINGTFNTTNDLQIKYPPINSASAQDLFVVDSNGANTSTRLKPNSIADHTTTGVTVGYDLEYSSDMFVFNECLVLNGATHKPLYLSSQGSQMAVVDNWPSDVTVPTATGNQIEFLASPKIAIYGGRLVALGLFGIKTDNTEGTYNEKATIIFSSPITQLASLAGIEWTVATTNTTVDDTITESPGAVIDGGQLGDDFIVYKSDIVLSYREITSSPYILGRVIQTDDGLISSRCFADIGNNRHIVFGNYGIFIHNGDLQKQIVSKGRINDTLYAELNYSRIGQCFVFRHEEDKETWFCIPTTSHSGEGCNKAYCYAEDTDSWYTRDLDNFTHIFSTELDGVTRIFACRPDSVSLQELSDTAVIQRGYAIFKNNSLDDTSITKTVSAIYPHVENNLGVSIKSVDKLTNTTFITKDFPLSGVYANPTTTSVTSFNASGVDRYTNINGAGFGNYMNQVGLHHGIQDSAAEIRPINVITAQNHTTGSYSGYPYGDNGNMANELHFSFPNHGLELNTDYYFNDFKIGEYSPSTPFIAKLKSKTDHTFIIDAPESDFDLMHSKTPEAPTAISLGWGGSFRGSWSFITFTAPFSSTKPLFNGTVDEDNYNSGSHPFIDTANTDDFLSVPGTTAGSDYSSQADTNLKNGIAVTRDNLPTARKLRFEIPYDARTTAFRTPTGGNNTFMYGGVKSNLTSFAYQEFPKILIRVTGVTYGGQTITESLHGPTILGTSFTAETVLNQNGTLLQESPIVYTATYFTHVTHITFNFVYLNPGATSPFGNGFGISSNSSIVFTVYPDIKIGWSGSCMGVRKDANNAVIPLESVSNHLNLPYINNDVSRTYNPTNDHKMDFRETGRYFDMKIEVPSTTDPKLTGMEFDVKPRGRR